MDSFGCMLGIRKTYIILNACVRALFGLKNEVDEIFFVVWVWGEKEKKVYKRDCIGQSIDLEKVDCFSE